MIREIAYTLFLTKPIIFWLGILTYLSFSATAIVGLLNYKGIKIIPFRWHPRLAVFSLTLATIHGLFGLSIYLNF